MATGSTLSPLAHRLFRGLWLTSLLGNLGNAVQGVGGAWMMTAIDGRADMVALVQSASYLPIMLLALAAGAFADLHDRRTVMLAAQGCSAVLSMLLAVLAWAGLVTPWTLIGFTFALGVTFAFYNPAALASIGRVVPRAELAGAASLNILGFNVARSAGPALGGAIVAAAGAVGAFVGNALAALGAMALLIAWRPDPEPPVERAGRSIARAMAQGLRTVRDSPPLRAVMLRALAFTLAGSAAWSLMPLIARDLVGGGPRQFGYLLGALGLGAVIGAAASHAVRRRLGTEAVVRAGGAVFGLAVVAVALQPGFAVSFAALVIGGAGWVQALSTFSVAAQLWAPRAVVGRVIATANTVVFGGLAIGGWAWGHGAELLGLAPVVAASGVAMLALPLLGLALPMPEAVAG